MCHQNKSTDDISYSIVLPKQKLSIVDNSQFTGSKQLELSQLKSRQSISNSYALSDFINLTCSSGFSKPAAKLTWFINDTPVINSTGLLTHHSEEMLTLQQQKQQLIGSKLSLSFRIGLEHLFNKNMYNAEKDGLQQQSYSKFLYENNLRPLNLRCVSRLTVEFSSETEILVLNGKSSLKRSRNLIENINKYTSKSESKREKVSKQAMNNISNRLEHNPTKNITSFEEYRWSRTSGGANSKQKSVVPTDSRLWASDMMANRDNDEESTAEPIYDEIVMSNNQMGNNLIVWTNQQLRSQSDFINQKLLIAHSNELEPPKIRASTQLNDILLDTDTVNSFVTPELENQTIKNEMRTPGYRNNELLVRKDSYHPNDIVKFTCSPRYALPDRVGVVKKVYSKWLINNKEVSNRESIQLQQAQSYLTSLTIQYILDYFKLHQCIQ